MRFSVLLSLYYKENPTFLRQSLGSVFCQTIPPDEVILVEDGELVPELYKVVEEFVSRNPNMKRVVLKENRGLGKALNEGLKHCSYDLIARMDTDDIAKYNRFEHQVKIFKEHPEIDIVSSWIDEFENDISNIISVRKLPESHNEIAKYARFRCPVNHPVVMFRKEAVMSAGGYQHFPFFEDYYLWVRMLNSNAKFYNIQKSLLYFRFSPDMFRRRGGWKYALLELKFLGKLRNMKFISKSEYLRNVFIRFAVRVIPIKLRSLVYKKMLR